jgi:AraC-like DNA-binding protein
LVDPFAEVVTLLQPGAPFSKLVNAAGPWRVRRSQPGDTFYGLILEGSCLLADHGRDPIELHKGDFVLIPSAHGFVMSSLIPPRSETLTSKPVELRSGEYRLGVEKESPDVQFLIGHCTFGSPDRALLISLLPELVLVRGEERLATLVQLVRDESRATRPARDVILARLMEVLLIESLRSMAGTEAPPGLVRGLADERLALALRAMHQDPTHAWTAVELAKHAALSRSAFFARFSHAVGVPPMEYLLSWRMALAKDLLRRKQGGVAEVAERVGYGSASAFSVAFSRYVGIPPAWFARREDLSPLA